MNFTVSTNDFKVAINKVVKVIPTKSSLEILENVHIIIKDNMCTLHTTDLTTTIVSKIPTNKMETGTINFILGDVKNIQKAMNFFKSDYVKFSIDGNVLTIICGNKKISKNIEIEAEEVNTFPCLPEIISNREYTYNAEDLKRRFNLVKYAIAKNGNNPILQGVHFNNNDMVTLDGCRMSINKDVSLSIDTPITILAEPLKIATDILKGCIKINTDSNYISITDENTTVFIRLLDGEFFNYKNAIPSEINCTETNIKDFTEAIKYLKTFISGKNRTAIQWFENELKLKTEKGMFEVSIKGTNQINDVIGFDCNLMVDALSQFEGEAEIYLNKKTSPILIKQKDNIALIMPTTIKEENNLFKIKKSV